MKYQKTGEEKVALEMGIGMGNANNY